MPVDESALVEHSPEWYDKFYEREDPHRAGSSLLEQRRFKEILVSLDAIQDEPKKVLDVGCGEGHFLSKLRGLYHNSNLYGVDISQKALDRASNKLPDATLYCLDLKLLEPSVGTYDLVLSLELLGSFDTNQLRVLNYVKGMVSPGGYLCVTQRAKSEWPYTLVKYHCNDFEIISYKTFAADVITGSLPGYIILARRIAQ